MRMKNFLQLAAAAAALTLTLTIGVSALADTEIPVMGDEGTKNISYRLAEGETTDPLTKTKNVTLSIDKTRFVYKKGTKEEWNRERGKVEIKDAGEWEDGNTATITVKNNNSEVGVKAQLSFRQREVPVKMAVSDTDPHVLQPSGTEGDTLTATLTVTEGVPTSTVYGDAGWVVLTLTDAEVDDLTTTS